MDFTLQNNCYAFGTTSSVDSLPYIHEYTGNTCGASASDLIVDTGCKDVGSGSGMTYEWKVLRGSQEQLVACGKLLCLPSVLCILRYSQLPLRPASHPLNPPHCRPRNHLEYPHNSQALCPQHSHPCRNGW